MAIQKNPPPFKLFKPKPGENKIKLLDETIFAPYEHQKRVLDEIRTMIDQSPTGHVLVNAPISMGKELTANAIQARSRIYRRGTVRQPVFNIDIESLAGFNMMDEHWSIIAGGRRGNSFLIGRGSPLQEVLCHCSECVYLRYHKAFYRNTSYYNPEKRKALPQRNTDYVVDLRHLCKVQTNLLIEQFEKQSTP